MSEDALQALLRQDDAGHVKPERDTGFVIAVMEKVERRRFLEALAFWAVGGVLVTAVLAVVMPYLTPALVTIGQEIVPAVAVLAVLGMVAVGGYYLRPTLRDWGLPV